MKILSVGNIVTLSIQLYRHYFWQSFRLSLIAFIWLLVPIYGWAKSCETLALISRLAWNHLGNRDEELPKAAKTLSRRTWTIFLSHILVGSFNVLMATVTAIILSILFILGVVVLFIIFMALSSSVSENLIYWLSLTYVFLCFLLTPLVMLWIYSRLFVFEAFLALETEVTVWQSIRTSWKLTRKLLQQVQSIIAIIWVFSILTFLVIWVISGFLAGLAIASLKLDQATQTDLIQICFYIIYSFSIILIQPIWQNAKTILYLDCKNRQEGLDLLAKADPIIEQSF